MAEQPQTFQFEDIPLEEARRMRRGPRMEPLLYDTLVKKMQSLAADAVRVRLGPEVTPQRMRAYIQQIARQLNVPVTVRRVPGGVIFWRSTDEDIQHAQEVGSRLQTARQQPHTRPRGRRPRK
jgi:hypothetical protein